VTTYRLRLEYDGTDFAGWQVQPGRRTVQGELETALRRLFRRRIKTVGASRTDAGVHAAGQTASFRVPGVFRGNLASGLNGALPKDMAVNEAETAPDGFHARRDATGKTYEYRFVNRAARPALHGRQCGWVSAPLVLAKMRGEARRLAGGPNRLRIAVGRREGELVVSVTGRRFSFRQVRRLVGRLVEAGLGRVHRNLPRTMEARGLCLKKVFYDKP
jgi:tRNA pseudouridine38-40 synthase